GEDGSEALQPLGTAGSPRTELGQHAVARGGGLGAGDDAGGGAGGDVSVDPRGDGEAARDVPARWWREHPVRGPDGAGTTERRRSRRDVRGGLRWRRPGR